MLRMIGLSLIAMLPLISSSSADESAAKPLVEQVVATAGGAEKLLTLLDRKSVV